MSFAEAQQAFFDPRRRDLAHSIAEERFYCIGQFDDGILTVRFTMRGDTIRIYGAGYWREGKKAYEEANRKKAH